VHHWTSVSGNRPGIFNAAGKIILTFARLVIDIADSNYRKRLKRTVISSLLQCSIGATKFAAASVSGVVGKHLSRLQEFRACGLPPYQSDWSTVWRRRTSLS
jgi:hypothetical protein